MTNLDADARTFSLTQPLVDHWKSSMFLNPIVNTRDFATQPTQYYNSLTDNGDGTVSITFWPDFDPNKNIRPDQVNVRYDLGTDNHDYVETSRTTRTTTATDTLVSAGAAATIQAQGAIRINADGGSIDNQSSTMAAGGDLVRRATGGSVNDTGTVLQQTITQESTSDFYWHQKTGGSNDTKVDVPNAITQTTTTVNALPAIATSNQNVQTNAQTITISSVDRQGQTVAGSGVSGGSADGTQTGMIIGQGGKAQSVDGQAATSASGASASTSASVAGNETQTVSGQTSAPQTVGGTTSAPQAVSGQTSAPQTLGGATGGIPNLRLPVNGLYTYNTAPGATYLIATDPRLTSYTSFISSDYMLKALDFDPQKTIKRLGDGAYEHHPAAAFFLPFSRFWELLAGALLAWSNQTQLAVESSPGNGRPVAGLVLCVIAMLGLNSTMYFPGWWALLPVVGACLMISGRNTVFNDRVLGWPPLVWVGKISYPLYLWHWPLLSFAAILAGGTPEPHVRAGAIALSIVLAWFTCFAIEKPFRFGKLHWFKVATPCVLLALVAYVGGMTFVRDGLVFRKGYSATADVNTTSLGAGHEFTKSECGVPSASQHVFNFCAEDRREKPRAVVWGDSKADSLFWGLVRASAADRRWALIARASCAPLTGVDQFNPAAKDDPELCENANRIALKTIVGDRALHVVVLAVAARDLIGPSFTDSTTKALDPDGAFNGIDRSIAALKQAGKQVVLVIDNPTLPDPRECMDRRLSGLKYVRALLSLQKSGVESDRCTITYRAHQNATAAYRAIVSRLQAGNLDLLVLDPTPILCDVSKGICPIARNGKYLYSYGDHISDAANGLIAAQLLPELSHVEAHASR